MTNDDRPRVRVLLDVDGVLNAVTGSPDYAQWDDWRRATALGFRITYSPTVGRRLAALVDAGVDVQWLTTWADRANEHIAPLLGLPQLPVAGAPPFRDRGWWKLDVARTLDDRDDVPFVWLDDDLDSVWDNGGGEWARALGALVISPDSRRGLTPAHLDEIEVFVTEALT